MIIPSLEKALKEGGEEGKEKINRYTKMLTILLALIEGIGIYVGINTIKTGDIVKDYLKIKYKGEDILYVPTDSLDAVRKFIGGGEQEPKLNKLGSKEWETTKNKVKNNLRLVAKDLIELYARRSMAKGYKFSPDNE